MRNHSPLVYAFLSGTLCLGSTIVPLSAMAADVSGGVSGVFADELPQGAISVTISGPGDDRSYETGEVALGGFPDGQYSYEVLGYLDDAEVPVPTAAENESNGRSADARPTEYPVGVVDSGAFTIANGVVVDQGIEEVDQGIEE